MDPAQPLTGILALFPQAQDDSQEMPASPAEDFDDDFDPADFVDPEDFRTGRRDNSFRGRFQ